MEELENLVYETKNKIEVLENKLNGLDKVEKSYFENICNEFQRIEKKIDSNFKYLDEKVDSIKDKMVTELINILEVFSINYTKLIENDENKTKTEERERQFQIEKLNTFTEYEKIILKNLESRISILEEESQNYCKE